MNISADYATFLSIPGFLTFNQHADIIEPFYPTFKSEVREMGIRMDSIMEQNNFTDITQLYRAIAIR